MAEANRITADYLREVLSYDPDTGVFTWKPGRARAGRIAGNILPKGYRYIGVGGGYFGAHRLAYLYMTGEWPEAEIDHINLVKDDNRWANLRHASISENRTNRRIQANNGVGLKGVVFCRWVKRYPYKAQIGVDGVSKSLGYFATAEEAHAKYCEASREIYGEFSRTD